MTSSFAHQTDSSVPYSQHYTRPESRFGYYCKGDNFNRFYRNSLSYLERLSASCNPTTNKNIIYTTHNLAATSSSHRLTPTETFNSHFIVDSLTTSLNIFGPSNNDVLAYFNNNPPVGQVFNLIITNNSNQTFGVNLTNPQINLDAGKTTIINVLVKANGEVEYFPFTK